MSDPAVGLRPADLAVPEGDGIAIAGWRCENGDYTTLAEAFRCPWCFGTMQAARFAPVGRVWSHTRVLVPSPVRRPPYTLAYVDLDEGPRVLCDVPDAAVAALRVGLRVRLAVAGDLLTVEPVAEEAA
jgi:uncharacterized protein